MTEQTARITAAAGAGSGFDTAAAADAAVGQVAEQLGADSPTLAIVFIGAAHTTAADTVAERIRAGLDPQHLLGATAGAVIANNDELEDETALSVWATHLPGATLAPLRYPAPVDPAESVDEQGRPQGVEWPDPPESADALLLLADPVSFPAPAFLQWLGQARPSLPVSGGMASGAAQPGGNRLVLDDDVFDDGAVAVALEGVRVRTLVSQGCRPVGSSYVVTGAEQNLLQELGGAPPVDRVREIYQSAPPEDQERMQSGLHIGTAIDEYKEEFGRGDFLVRGVLGAQQDTGALVVGDLLDVGQTVQFHVRDAASADEDLRELLSGFADDAAPRAGLLFTCNGRGQRLFNEANHDASLVRSALDDTPLAGFFCAGEFGPVGQRSFVHGFTASVVLFEPVEG
jgi:small ligand-binding sensory domain FIST